LSGTLFCSHHKKLEDGLPGAGSAAPWCFQSLVSFWPLILLHLHGDKKHIIRNLPF
jgi:hypothetical protein